MDRKKYVIDMIANIVGGPARVQTAELIVERLHDEGLLKLGYGDADVDRVVSTFKETFGVSRTTKYDRLAAQRLIVTNGAAAVVWAIQALGQLRNEQYAPVANSVAQLESKWTSVINFLRKRSSGTETIAV